MSRTVKLYSKGKPKNIEKSTHNNKFQDDKPDSDQVNTSIEFELQLCWCIKKLETSICRKISRPEKELQEIWKLLIILKNEYQPIIRKRQLMRTYFGDYRAKMALEQEKELAKMMSKTKISESAYKPKAKFLRKSAFLKTGKSSFKFNFNLAPDTMKSEAPVTNKSDEKGDPKDDGNEKCNEIKTEKKIDFGTMKSDFKFNFNIK